jgi:hypothetical protein
MQNKTQIQAWVNDFPVGSVVQVLTPSTKFVRSALSSWLDGFESTNGVRGDIGEVVVHKTTDPLSKIIGRRPEEEDAPTVTTDAFGYS